MSPKMQLQASACTREEGHSCKHLHAQGRRVQLQKSACTRVEGRSCKQLHAQGRRAQSRNLLLAQGREKHLQAQGGGVQKSAGTIERAQIATICMHKGEEYYCKHLQAQGERYSCKHLQAKGGGAHLLLQAPAGKRRRVTLVNACRPKRGGAHLHKERMCHQGGSAQRFSVFKTIMLRTWARGLLLAL
eukprot:724688-Pelagomonas_calceolata.AAC.10